MRRVRWYRSTPVRLSLAVAGLVFATFLIAGVIAYSMIGSRLSERRDRWIREIFSELSNSADGSGSAAVVDAVRAKVAAISDRSTIIQLRGADGQVIAGNAPRFDAPDGWSNLPPELFGVDDELPFRGLTETIGDLRLSVALSSADMEETREILFGALLWSSVFVLAATLFAASVLAARAQRRLGAVQGAIDRVAEGDLGARIELMDTGDDIDLLSGQINAALERLQASVEAMRQVSADIAHELRTPLNRLHLKAESALDKTACGDTVVEELSEVLAESEAIAGTFAALLRIAQVETGARRERFAPVDLGALVRDVAEVYADVAADSDMALHADARAGSWVMGDRELLTQATANLIENAIRHCPAGTRIDCAVSTAAGRATLSVADTGPGIPEAEREAVLRRLYRLEKSRTTPGTGLGLSLVKAVADLHGAELSLADRGPGLEVRLRFALTQAPAPAAS